MALNEENSQRNFHNVCFEKRPAESVPPDVLIRPKCELQLKKHTRMTLKINENLINGISLI